MSNNWYNVIIKYELSSNNQIKTTFWINYNRVGEFYSTRVTQEDELNKLQLSVGEGSAWFDNVKIYKSLYTHSDIVNEEQHLVIIYPNPTNNLLNIEFISIPQKYTIELYNNLGQLVIQKQSAEQSEQLDLKGMVSGVYYLKVSNNEFIKTGKIVVK